MLSPEMPIDRSVVRVGSSSTCRRFGGLDITIMAPLVDVLGLYRTCVSALADPVMIWFNFSCQRTLINGEPFVTGVTSSGFRVAGLRMCRLPSSDPVTMDEELGVNWMFDVGY